MPSAWRYLLVYGLIAAALIGALMLGPIPQDPTYHRFADSRACGALPNCLNVLSSLALVGVGGFGLRSAKSAPAPFKPALRVFWWGVGLTGLGSTWYHLAPDASRLVWDRLPMTLAFMGFLAAVLIDQFQLKAWILPALIALGLASIAVWWAFDDLRLYGLVQFLPPVIVLAIFALFPPGRLARRPVYWGLACYAAAKFAERLDAEIFLGTGWISGHTLKHLLAALAAAWIMAILKTAK
ncbi:ceramidase domain-containing protein [Methylothermus subterraneus]